MTQNTPVRMDRRTTLKWLLAGLSAPTILAACDASDVNSYEPTLLGPPRAVSGMPYGGDPDLLNPSQTWELTMNQAQRNLVDGLCEIVLPAFDGVPSGSALGIPDFIDEWVSAPYDRTLSDRDELFALFEWLERKARDLGHPSFAEAERGAQASILDQIAWRENSNKPRSDNLSRAFDLFRDLSVSAYFASREGSDWIGYVGNRPIIGPYPGPSKAALEHLQIELDKLSLALPEHL